MLALSAENRTAPTWLDRIIDGEALGAFAHEEGRGTADQARIATTATLDSAGYRLTGEKRLVLGRGDARVLVVTVRMGGGDHTDGELGLLLLALGMPGVSISAYRTVGGRRRPTVRSTAFGSSYAI